MPNDFVSPVSSPSRGLPDTHSGDRYQQAWGGMLWGAREVVEDAAVVRKGTEYMVEINLPYPRLLDLRVRWDDTGAAANVDLLVSLGFPGPRAHAWQGAIGQTQVPNVTTAPQGVQVFGAAGIITSRLTVIAFGNAITTGRPLVVWAGVLR